MTREDDGALPPISAIRDAFAKVEGIPDPSTLSIQVVDRRSHLSKQLIELHVAGERGDRRIMGKSYTSRDKGSRAYRAMRAIWKASEGGRPLIVRPIAYLSEWDFLLMEKAGGQPLHDCVIGEDGRPPPATELDTLGGKVARWLVRLHALPPIPGLRNPARARPEEQLARMIGELRTSAEGEGERLSRLAGRLAGFGTLISDVEEHVTLHGDLNPFNLFIDGTDVMGIDVDHAGVGDPAWDVGYVVGQLQCAASDQWGEATQLDTLTRSVIDRYLAGLSGEDSTSFRHRVDRFRALTFLESAHYRRCILHIEDGSLGRLLAECERALDSTGQARATNRNEGAEV